MPRRLDRGLIAALAVGAVLSLYQLDWGLPAVEHSWAVDGLEPLTVLGIAKSSFAKWNSGYFYFKYPLAYPLTVAASYAPYLGYLFVTGQWSRPQSAYPYGFAAPEEALLVLALVGRLVSVAFTLATIAVAFAIARRLFGLFGARLAAWLVATSYPLLFYAHTMNADASYLFWMLAALLAAIVAADSSRALHWAALGVTAAMAVSTKEQAFGFLLPLPLLAVWFHSKQPVGESRPYRLIGIMSLAALVTAVLANNALYNPFGVVARLAYLVGSPITPVDAPLKPVAFSWFKGGLEWTYLRQFWNGVDSALGTAMAWLALASAIAVWRRPRAAAWLLLPAIGYYYLSLRGQQLITMRYSLPAILLLVLLVSGFLAQLRESMTGAARTAVVGLTLVLAALSLARGVELDLLLANDARYQAEAWMRTDLPAGAKGEVYQKPTYVPRAPAHVTLSHVPLSQRSLAGLQQRRPDFIVLSSESRQSITKMWNPDWRSTGDLLIADPDATSFLRALEAGGAGYERAAVFRQQPWLLRPEITGLCPEIVVYRRAGL